MKYGNVYTAIVSPLHPPTRRHVQPTTIYRHALMMVSLTHQFHWRVSSRNPQGTPSFHCFQHPVPCSHLIEPRHCLHNNYMYGTDIKQETSESIHADSVRSHPHPTRRHSTSHNNISPCTIDGVINSPVAIKNFLLTARGNALRLRSTHRAVSALGSVFTRVGATILSAIIIALRKSVTPQSFKVIWLLFAPVRSVRVCFVKRPCV